MVNKQRQDWTEKWQGWGIDAGNSGIEIQTDKDLMETRGSEEEWRGVNNNMQVHSLLT